MSGFVARHNSDLTRLAATLCLFHSIISEAPCGNAALVKPVRLLAEVIKYHSLHGSAELL